MILAMKKTQANQVKKILERIQRGVRGCVCNDFTALEKNTTDFGRIAHKQPILVVEATCEQDIIHCLATSREYGIPVKMRGSGHTFNGQSLCEGAIIISNSQHHGEIRVLNNDLVDVTARTSWHQLEVELNKRERSAPVLTDYLGLTVGGTLSVGGYGARSITSGTQVEQVERLRLILPNGEAIWCSPEENQALFHFGLGTLGQLGIIERVVMKTVPFRKQSVSFGYYHPNLLDLAKSIQWMDESDGPFPDFFHALLLDGVILSKYGREYLDGQIERNKWHPQLMPSRPPAKIQAVENYALWSHDVQVHWMKQFPTHKAIWGDYFFDYQGFLQFTEVVTEMREALVAPYIWGVYVTVARKTERSSLFPFIPSSKSSLKQFSYSTGVYNLIPTNDHKGLDQVQELQAILLDECIRLGGLPYLYGSYELDREKMGIIYGEPYQRLREMRQALDPTGLVNPGAFPF